MTKTGQDVLNDPFLNHGTGFTSTERKTLHLQGLLPPQVQTIDQQAQIAYEQVQGKNSNLEKRLFLMTLFNTNRTLFFYLFRQHLPEFMPLVYDPTIAETIENYSHLFINPQQAAFLSINHQNEMAETLKTAAAGRSIKLIVVTDGEAILGIGDWGTQGVDIAIGKLMVYTAAAGLDPAQVLPVVLDAGTNNSTLLQDPFYLGLHQQRIQGEPYYQFVDNFVQTAEQLFPNMYLHFEDFGRDNAAAILNHYQDQFLTFNDDIQGTGIIVLSAILGALKISQQKLTEQKYLCFGAGTAGMGIVKQIYHEMIQEGLSPTAAQKRFYLVDKQGLLFDDTVALTPEQKPFTRSRKEFAHSDSLTTLKAAVTAIQPTILVGTSTQAGAFDEDIVQAMSRYTPRPIIFPLSNPTKLAEATAADLIKWSHGRALVATGIPSAPVDYQGISYQIGQANNALVYPGLGMGAIAAQAKILSADMISAAAHSLGEMVDFRQPGAAVLPPISQLELFSQTIAENVCNQAIKDGLSQNNCPNGAEAVGAIKWSAHY